MRTQGLAVVGRGTAFRTLDQLANRRVESAVEVGPLVKLQTMWRALPGPEANQSEMSAAIRALRDYLVPSTGSYGNRMTVRSWAGQDLIGSKGEELLEQAGFRRDYPAMTFDAVQSRVLSSR